MKKLVNCCYDAVFFEVDLFNIDVDFDWDVQINELCNLPHPIICFDNYVDAREAAKQMINYIPEYNYAIVTLEHYRQLDELDSEGNPMHECVNCEIVAEFASKEIEEINGDK